MDLLLGLIAGAFGGVAAGAVLRSLFLGKWTGTLAGMAGGGLAAWAAPLGGGMADSLPAMLVTGAAGGALLSAGLGVVRNTLRR